MNISKQFIKINTTIARILQQIWIQKKVSEANNENARTHTPNRSENQRALRTRHTVSISNEFSFAFGSANAKCQHI